MEMYSASDLKKGLKIEIDGYPWVITDFDFCKPGKGTALYRCKLKNLMTGASMDRTFRPVDKVGKPDLEEREMHFIYDEGDNCVFSDSETYDEVRIPKEILGNKAKFLVEDARQSSSTAIRLTSRFPPGTSRSSPKPNRALAAIRLPPTS